MTLETFPFLGLIWVRQIPPGLKAEISEFDEPIKLLFCHRYLILFYCNLGIIINGFDMNSKTINRLTTISSFSSVEISPRSSHSFAVNKFMNLSKHSPDKRYFFIWVSQLAIIYLPRLGPTNFTIACQRLMSLSLWGCANLCKWNLGRKTLSVSFLGK